MLKWELRCIVLQTSGIPEVQTCIPDGHVTWSCDHMVCLYILQYHGILKYYLHSEKILKYYSCICGCLVAQNTVAEIWSNVL